MRTMIDGSEYTDGRYHLQAVAHLETYEHQFKQYLSWGLGCQWYYVELEFTHLTIRAGTGFQLVFSECGSKG